MNGKSVSVLALLLCLAPSLNAAGAAGNASSNTDVLQTTTKASSTTPTNVGPTSPNRVLPGEPTAHKNYWVPALEIPLFQLTLNGLDRVIYGSEDYGSDFNSGWRHVVHGPWVVDQDAFSVNQIGHPYQGSMYYGFARSSGLNFWEGLAYSNVGSFVWETYGELTDPSINDQVASGTAGALIGEPLFRMASLVLDEGGENPNRGRKIAAAFISPPLGLNRLVFGDSYAPTIEHRHPATFTQLQIGAGANTSIKDPGNVQPIGHRVAVAQFQMAYGLPGKPGYLYLRPFDYFDFELSGLMEQKSHFENIMVRGLLFGRKYEAGDDYRGVWGLYGSYDYLSPQVFRLSTTAASFGTTAQWWLSKSIALQGTGLGGSGLRAAGTITPLVTEPDYHYGATPQGLLALRLILGKYAMIDSTARGYYITNAGSNKAPGTEKIARLNSAFVVRLFKHHALGINYLVSTRDAHYTSTTLQERHQNVQTVSLVYNFIGNLHFGAVEWRGIDSD